MGQDAVLFLVRGSLIECSLECGKVDSSVQRPGLVILDGTGARDQHWKRTQRQESGVGRLTGLILVVTATVMWQINGCSWMKTDNYCWHEVLAE